MGKIPERVHFLGYAPDEYLPALYSGALVFTYMSLYEGFGLPPLEAMACGVPVITGNQSSLPEVIGNAGLMVDPFTVREIAASIEKIVNDDGLRQSLSAKGLIRSTNFSWENASAATIRILQEVAAA